MLLLGRENVTAQELSARYGVSTRTIYRDIDALSFSGIPVYSVKGKGGGIRLLPEYTVDKSIVSKKEQKDILFALQSLHALHFPDVEATLQKLSGVFRQTDAQDWIEVDFSYWGSGAAEKEKFNLLKEAILHKRQISFAYFGADAVKTQRSVEPLKLFFKSSAWYLYGYALERADYRLFRISRIQDLHVSQQTFARSLPPKPEEDIPVVPPGTCPPIRLKFSVDVLHRIYDDFAQGQITQTEDGALSVTLNYPLSDWLVGYLLSFAGAVEVLEPPALRTMLVARAKEIIDLYGEK